MNNMTAKVSCFARAYHTQNSGAPVFADTAAKALLGPDYDRIAQSLAQGVGFFLPGFHGSAEEGLRRIVDGQLAPSVLVRSAWCEAALANERRLGCRQYAVFAAGYDTFAIRSRDAALAVYELDLPDVLADKRARAARAGLTTGAIDVPCDLSGPSWRDELLSKGFRRDARAFASLLGISYYLEAPALQSLLAALGGVLCEGSALCLDYPTQENGREAQTNRALAQGAGEPMRALRRGGDGGAAGDMRVFGVRASGSRGDDAPVLRGVQPALSGASDVRAAGRRLCPRRPQAVTRRRSFHRGEQFSASPCHGGGFAV